MDFRIRTAAAADVPAMHHIRQNVQENRLSDPTSLSEASYMPFIAAGSAWVAETDQRIGGFAVLDLPARRVWALFVDPGSEGVGLGRALHDRMLAWAQKQGLRHIWLSTSGETRAERFYTRAGWLKTGFTAEGEVRFTKILGS